MAKWTSKSGTLLPRPRPIPGRWSQHIGRGIDLTVAKSVALGSSGAGVGAVRIGTGDRRPCKPHSNEGRCSEESTQANPLGPPLARVGRSIAVEVSPFTRTEITPAVPSGANYIYLKHVSIMNGTS